eukprot:851588-Rhodomonas_salina.1
MQPTSEGCSLGLARLDVGRERVFDHGPCACLVRDSPWGARACFVIAGCERRLGMCVSLIPRDAAIPASFWRCDTPLSEDNVWAFPCVDLGSDSESGFGIRNSDSASGSGLQIRVRIRGGGGRGASA